MRNTEHLQNKAFNSTEILTGKQLVSLLQIFGLYFILFHSHMEIQTHKNF